MSVGFRHDSIMQIGGYPDIRLREDYALWAKFIANNFLVYNLDQILVEASVGENMIHRRGGFKNLVGEVKLQYFMFSLGIQRLAPAIFYGSFRGIACLLPVIIRKSIYRRLLRDTIVIDHWVRHALETGFAEQLQKIK